MVTHTCELEDVPAEECDQCMRQRDEEEYQDRLYELRREFGYE